MGLDSPDLEDVSQLMYENVEDLEDLMEKPVATSDSMGIGAHIRASDGDGDLPSSHYELYHTFGLLSLSFK